MSLPSSTLDSLAPHELGQQGLRHLRPYSPRCRTPWIEHLHLRLVSGPEDDLRVRRGSSNLLPELTPRAGVPAQHDGIGKKPLCLLDDSPRLRLIRDNVNPPVRQHPAHAQSHHRLEIPKKDARPLGALNKHSATLRPDLLGRQGTAGSNWGNPYFPDGQRLLFEGAFAGPPTTKSGMSPGTESSISPSLPSGVRTTQW